MKLPAYATSDSKDGITDYPALLLCIGGSNLLHIAQNGAYGGSLCGANGNGRPTNLVEYVGDRRHPVCVKCRKLTQ